MPLLRKWNVPPAVVVPAALAGALAVTVFATMGAADDQVVAALRTAVSSTLVSVVDAAVPALRASAVRFAGMALVLVAVVFPYGVVLAIPAAGICLLASAWRHRRRPRS